MYRKILLAGAICTLLSAGLALQFANASDHDDGEIDLKGRSLNLTDLFVFREDWQSSTGSANHLIFIMNTNPRSVARQQYFFSTTARYEFHVSTATGTTAAPTTLDDVILRFTFGEPDSDNRQPMTITTIRGSGTDTATETATGGTILTTSLLDSDASSERSNEVSIGGETITVFAGLREDPFFFDVEQYFRVRAGALGAGPSVLFRSAATAVDFAAGYNVNALVVRIPISLLQDGGSETVFDVWETISVPE